MAANIVLAFDGDRAGKEAAWRCLPGILPTLGDGMSVSFLFLPEAEDPDSFIRARGKSGMEEAIAAAKPLSEYMAERLWTQPKSASTEGKYSAALSAGQKLVAMLDADKAPYLRETLMSQLSLHAGIAPTVMKRAIARPRTTDNKSRFKMRQEGILFNFLSCVAAHPNLWDNTATPPPLQGNAAESKVTAMVLHYLRTHSEDNGEPDVIGFLNGEGFIALARQIRERCRESFDDSKDPQAELTHFIERLHVRFGNRKHLPYRPGIGGKKFVHSKKHEPGDEK